MTPKTKIIILATLAIFTLSCSKDDDSNNTPPQSNEKQILNFVFNTDDNDALTENITTTIDENNKTITAIVSFGTNINTLIPTIQVSEKANVNPIGAQNFSSLVTYTVIAENDSTVTYEVSISIEEGSSEKQILNFTFNVNDNNTLNDDIIANINDETKTIVFKVPSGTDLTTLIPTVEISPEANINPSDVQDFGSPVTYTVTAQDGTTVIYKARVYSQIDVLIDLYNTNPNNTLDWVLSDTNINNWTGVTTNVDGNITELELDSKNLDIIPSEIELLTSLSTLNLRDNNLTNIPDEINQLTNLTSLILENNNLTTLPDEIEELDELETLYLSNNNFSTIPNGVYLLNNLITLKLGGNGLTTIPASFLFLFNLEHLNLSDNNITTISDSIFVFGAPNWTTLELGGNNLTSIPSSFGLLTGLTTLSLEDNELTSIPTEIGQLTNLTTLSLEGNNLTTIPQAVCDLNIEILITDNGVTCE